MGLGHFITDLRKPSKKWIIAALVAGLVVWWCSDSYGRKDHLILYMEGTSSAEFVDFLYVFAKTHRLTVRWADWDGTKDASHQVNDARPWREKSRQDARFRVTLGLFVAPAGSISFADHPEQPVIRVTIHYGHGGSPWYELARDFKKVVAARGWRLEDVPKILVTSS